MLSELWRRFIFKSAQKNVQPRRRLKRRRVRPLLEQLENRELLTTATPSFIINPTSLGSGLSSGAQPLASPDPSGFSPSQIQNAYGFNNISFASYKGGSNGPLPGTGQTIAIVDAYNAPNISSDLQTFDQQYGLANPKLTVLNENGGTTLPAADSSGGWEVEESLDVEWAHAVAPGANIVLVEANSASFSDLLIAVHTAAGLPGVSVVSMSWGGYEFYGESGYDSYFTTPSGHQGVTFVASSGDSGAPPIYPAASPNVLAVGGTTLSLNSSGGYGSETGWSGSGGGLSLYETQPSYQNGVVTQSSTQRANPDVAYDADPNTGFPVYDSTPDPSYGFYGGWIEVGGTSDAAPQWAGLIAIANQGRAQVGKAALDGPSQTLPMIYQMPSSNFHDITTGYNGYSAGPGYDLVTGRGTPIANDVINYLINQTSPPPPPTPAAPTNLTATAASSSQINLSWKDPTSDSDDTYVIERSNSSTGSFSPIFTTAANAASYTDSGLAAGTTYYYEVYADNNGVYSASPSNMAYATTLSASPPAAPTNLTATAASSSQINLTWTAPSSDAGDNYIIESSVNGSPWTVVGSTTGTTYSDTGLTADTTYSYEVYAENNGVYSSPSNIASATTLSASPPPAPTGLTAKAVSTSQIDLSWNTDSGATDGYDIYRSLNGNSGSWMLIGYTFTASATTYNDTGLSPDTKYFYEVVAVGNNGDSSPSKDAYATTASIPAPSGLKVTGVTSSAIDLSWSTDSAADYGYDIYRSLNGSSGSWTLIGSTYGANATTYSDTYLSPDTTYYYEVTADDNGYYSAPSNVVSATTGSIPPPQNLTVTGVTSSAIDLSWSTDSAADYGYDIYRSLNGSSGSWTLIGSTYGATATTYSDTYLSPDTTYYYEVTADDNGYYSAPSKDAYATTASIQPPTGLTATAVSSSQINLSWNSDSDANYGYDIYRSLNPTTSGWTFIGSTYTASATSYSDTYLSPGTKYYYEVTAVTIYGDSSPSKIVSATTQNLSNSGQLSDGGFEQPSVGANYVYDPTGTPWTFSSTAGVAGNGSFLTIYNPNAPEGSQVGFLSGYGSGFSQTVALDAGNAYTLSFDAAQAGIALPYSQTFEVVVGNTVLGTYTPSSSQYANYATVPFSVSASGNYTIQFMGTYSTGGIALVDDVSLAAAPLVQSGQSVSSGQALASPSGSPGSSSYTILGGNSNLGTGSQSSLPSNQLSLDSMDLAILLATFSSPTNLGPADQLFAQAELNPIGEFNNLFSAMYLSPLVTGLRPQAATDPFGGPWDWA